MTSATITANVTGMHREPDSDSEQTTQGIMGQVVTVEATDGAWAHVRTPDGYQAWIRRSALSEVVDPVDRPIVISALIADALLAPTPLSRIATKLVLSTLLQLLDEKPGYLAVRIPPETVAWVRREDVAAPTPDGYAPSAAGIIHTAERLIGVPYLWGGTTPFGIDCSGFTQLVYGIHGCRLPRDAWMQVEWDGSDRVDVADIRPADMIFFSRASNPQRATHVAIAIDANTVIHAAGGGTGVVVSRLDTDLSGRNILAVKRASAVIG